MVLLVPLGRSEVICHRVLLFRLVWSKIFSIFQSHFHTLRFNISRIFRHKFLADDLVEGSSERGGAGPLGL